MCGSGRQVLRRLESAVLEGPVWRLFLSLSRLRMPRLVQNPGTSLTMDGHILVRQAHAGGRVGGPAQMPF